MKGGPAPDTRAPGTETGPFGGSPLLLPWWSWRPQEEARDECWWSNCRMGLGEAPCFLSLGHHPPDGQSRLKGMRAPGGPAARSSLPAVYILAQCLLRIPSSPLAFS